MDIYYTLAQSGIRFDSAFIIIQGYQSDELALKQILFIFIFRLFLWIQQEGSAFSFTRKCKNKIQPSKFKYICRCFYIHILKLLNNVCTIFATKLFIIYVTIIKKLEPIIFIKLQILFLKLLIIKTHNNFFIFVYVELINKINLIY